MVALHERLKTIMNCASEKNSTRSSRSKTAVTSINCRPREWTKYIRSIENRYSEVRVLRRRCCRRGASSTLKEYALCSDSTTTPKPWSPSTSKSGRTSARTRRVKARAAADPPLSTHSKFTVIIALHLYCIESGSINLSFIHSLALRAIQSIKITP